MVHSCIHLGRWLRNGLEVVTGTIPLEYNISRLKQPVNSNNNLNNLNRWFNVLASPSDKTSIFYSG